MLMGSISLCRCWDVCRNPLQGVLLEDCGASCRQIVWQCAQAQAAPAAGANGKAAAAAELQQQEEDAKGATSDEELARRLHEQLNGEGPSALARRRRRKQPAFYTPQVWGDRVLPPVRKLRLSRSAPRGDRRGGPEAGNGVYVGACRTLL